MALGGFFNKLKAGLTRSTEKLTGGLTAAFNKRTLDDDALAELEELLLGADLGPAAATDIVEAFRRSKFGRSVTDAEIKESLAEEIAVILAPVAKPLVLDRARKPHVILVVGVNGTGKTTTIGKLALQYREEGLRPILVAGDTFRAAAVEQLQVWGDRTGAPVIAGPPNADAAGLVFDALTRARAEGADVLLVDTAGRLHNKAALMDELAKIIRVMRKQDPSAATFRTVGAGRDHGAQRAGAGARVQGDGGRHRPDRYEAGWQRARRHRGGAGRRLWLARARRRCRRAGRRPASVRSNGLRPRPSRRPPLASLSPPEGEGRGEGQPPVR